MSRATSNPSDENVLCAVANRNAVVSSPDDRVCDSNIDRAAQVDTIGIWAFLRGSYLNAPNLHIFTICHLCVKTHAVHKIQIVYLRVCYRLQDQRLAPFHENKSEIEN